MNRIQIKHLLMIVLALGLTAGCKTKHPPVTHVNGHDNDMIGNGVGMGNKLEPGGGVAADFNPDSMQQDRLRFAADTVYFEYDSASVSGSEQSKVQAVADGLRSDPSAKLLVEGHCDERGTEEYNRSLGERRALSIRESLATMGIDPQRVATRSYGEDRPADSAQGESAWRKNRRGEFVLLH